MEQKWLSFDILNKLLTFGLHGILTFLSETWIADRGGWSKGISFVNQIPYVHKKVVN